MAWNLNEALDYYGGQGAPSNQAMLISLLKEIQQESGNGISLKELHTVAEAYGIRESFLLAVMKQVPGLKAQAAALSSSGQDKKAARHTLEICCGKACSGRARLAACAEAAGRAHPDLLAVRKTGCMHLCGKGPVIRFDGKLYLYADESLIHSLTDCITE